MSIFENWETRSVRDLSDELGACINPPDGSTGKDVAMKFAEIIVKKTFRTVACMETEVENEPESNV